MQYLEDIVSYYRNLCAQHPDLQHGEDSGERVFEVRVYEEAFAAIRTEGKEKDYQVRLIIPSLSLVENSGDARKLYQFGLLVLKYHSRREQDRFSAVAAMSAAERVADSIVARMIRDSRAGEGPFQNLIDNPDSIGQGGDFVQAEGDGSYVGILYFFTVPVDRYIDKGCNTAFLDGK